MVDEADLSKAEETNTNFLPTQKQANESRKHESIEHGPRYITRYDQFEYFLLGLLISF